MGQKAPRVEIWSVQGDTLSMLEIEGKVLLTFFRYAACPICNYRVHELSEAYDSLTGQGFTVIGIFESQPELMKTYVEEYQVPFHVVADPDGVIYSAYGVKKSLMKTARYSSKKRVRYFHEKGEEYYLGTEYKRDASLYRSTADFVIENNTITNLSYNQIIGDHLPLKDL